MPGHSSSLQRWLGRGQAWHVRWRGGRRASPCRPVPLFLTPVSVRMVHAALCNADADEGKVPFSARVSGFPIPPCHRHPASVSLCVTINLLPPPPASLSLCLSGCAAAVSPSRDMSPRGVAQSLRGPWVVVARGPCFTPVWLQAQPCSSTKPFTPVSSRPQTSRVSSNPKTCAPTVPIVPSLLCGSLRSSQACLETLPIFGGALLGSEPSSPPFSWEETVCTARVGSESCVPAGLQPGGDLLCHLQAPAQGHPAALHLLPAGPR